MANLNKFILTFMLLHGLNCLAAGDKFENFNKTSTHIEDDLQLENVTLNEQHKLVEVKETLPIVEEISKADKTPDVSDPLNSPDSSGQPTNRTGRQLFYSPNFFFVQNYGSEGSSCVTSRGLVGVCMPFTKCLQSQKLQNQPLFIQQWPAQTQALSFFQYQQQQAQQQDFCTYYDQFARSAYGICCLVDMHNITPVNSPTPNIPFLSGEQNFQRPANNEDSEVLEADLSSYQPPPPTYDNTDNTIDNDPIENLKQASWLSSNHNNYINYPWPQQQQFVGFAGVQQWPPPVPTHPPSIASWPPPLPTHPPNHQYPTHPPLNVIIGAGSSNYYPSSSSTTRRPHYPSYPTHRPTTSSSTTAAITSTTKKPDSTETSMLGLPLQCGLKNAENPDQERIVGGTNASPNEFPWIAVLFKSGKQFCGGSLITNNHILTAAHCVARMTSWDVATLTVHLGDYNIRTDFEVRHTTRRIKRLVRHKGFDFSTLHNDIAILTLSEPVHYTKEIQPICLPTSTVQQSRSYSGQIATVAGWGSLRENGPQPSILQKVQIPIWTNTECAQKYGRAAPAGIISSMICAGQVAKDSCSGDSGGPLIVNDGTRHIQVGIVSWGIGCGKGQYPGVYTRVTSLLPWIYKNIK